MASSSQKRPYFGEDSDSDDDFVSIGTALSQIDEDEPLKKPTAIQDLTARDKQGRRRFHGAFTGGFSAGYFNSVGTKEGFTPSTFVSSRVDKHDGLEARPEDFMDEEDLEEHGIAPRKYVTHGNYTSEERKRKREEDHVAGQPAVTLGLGTTLLNLITPENLPIGMKLLRKMGWRDGQGIGPRRAKQKKKTKKKALGVKTYGCALPPSDNSDSDNYIPEDLSDVTFAPQDVSPMPLGVKDNVHGLGYRGLDPGLALAGAGGSGFSSTAVVAGRSKRGIRGQAFGVGAFEDEDEDIYTVDNMSNYDLTMQVEDERDTNFGWTAPKKHGKQNVPVDYVGKLLEGFCLSSKPPPQKKKYPRPELPRHFRPVHWFRKKRGLGHLPDELTVEGGAASTPLTAVDRGLLLGEAPVMESVFDLVPQKDKDRISAAKEAISMTKDLASKSAADTNVPSNSQEVKSEPGTSSDHQTHVMPSKFKPAETRLVLPPSEPTPPSSSSSLQREAGKSLFLGSLSIQPFRRDPAKQQRYDQYLALAKHGHEDAYSVVAVPGMTEWERCREREEFSKAAKLYRPMSAMMSSRFVSSGTMIDENTEDQAKSEPEKSDQMQAAEMKMFGKLTRTELEWHPDKLLCKKFNVPNPYPGSDVVGVPSVKRDKFSVFNFLSVGDYQPKEDTTDLRESKSRPERPEKNREEDPKMRDAIKGSKQKKKSSFASLFDALDDPNFHKPGVFSQGGASTPGGVAEDGDTSLSSAQTSNATVRTSSTAKGGGDVKQSSRTASEEAMSRERDMEAEEDAAKSDEDLPPTQDLFRAIFKNSDSEDSESDDKEEEEDEDESDDEREGKATSPLGENVVSGTTVDPQRLEGRQESGGENVEENKSDMDISLDNDRTGPPMFSIPQTANESEHPTSNSTAVVKVEEEEEDAYGPTPLVQDAYGPTPPVPGAAVSLEDSPDEYGPTLPPPTLGTARADTGLGMVQLVSRDDNHSPYIPEARRDKHRHRDHKHKKDKKKKSKKQKKEKKKKRHKSSNRHRGGGAGTSSDTDSDLSDGELLDRLRCAAQGGVSLKTLKHQL